MKPTCVRDVQPSRIIFLSNILVQVKVEFIGEQNRQIIRNVKVIMDFQVLLFFFVIFLVCVMLRKLMFFFCKVLLIRMRLRLLMVNIDCERVLCHLRLVVPGWLSFNSFVITKTLVTTYRYLCVTLLKSGWFDGFLIPE
jgi:hypothetical protein